MTQIAMDLKFKQTETSENASLATDMLSVQQPGYEKHIVDPIQYVYCQVVGWIGHFLWYTYVYIYEHCQWFVWYFGTAI